MTPAFLKIALTGAAGLALMAAATWLFLHNQGRPPKESAVADVVAPPARPLLPPESIFFLGDVMLARDVETRLKAEPADYAFAELPELRAAAAVVANFEASVPEAHTPTPSLTMKFSVATSLLPVLEAGGVTHLSLANNHALDYLEAGYRHTIKELRDHGFTVFGHPAAVSEKSVAYLPLRGEVAAIIGINATYGRPAAAEWRPILEEASARSDFQIAYIHWGEEYALRHDEAQADLAHELIDAGADLIIGHHPHVVQDIEEYRGALIFYSLGNFIFDQYFSRDVQQGLMLELAADEEGSAIALHPVESLTQRVQPRRQAGEERAAFLAGLADRSAPALADAIRAGRLPLQF